MDKRPYEYTEEVAIAALRASEKAKKYITQYLEGEPWSDEIAGQVAGAYEYCDGDAYKMAKNLDDHYYWEGGDHLMDMCECVLPQIHDYYKNVIVPEWIKASGITSPFAIGDKAIHKDYGEGEVTKIDEKDASNYIHFPSQAGKNKGYGYIASIIRWESTEVKKA
jgi:hypothetical protein